MPSPSPSSSGQGSNSTPSNPSPTVYVGDGDDGEALRHAIARLRITGVLAPPPSPIGLNVAAHTHDPVGPPVVPAETSSSLQRTSRSPITKTRRKPPQKSRTTQRPPTPRCRRVWRLCHFCGHLNHNRRLFCPRCLTSRRRD